MATLLIDYAETVRVERSAEAAFDRIADIDLLFAAMERKAPIDVERLSGGGDARVGDKWRVSGKLRIGRREGIVEIAELSRPTRIAFATTGGGYRTETEIVIAHGGAATCELSARNRIFATSLKARLAAPLIRLYRKRIERGFRRLMKRVKRMLER